MPAPKRPVRKTPLATPEQAQERYAFMDQVIRQMRPNGFSIDEVESALGMYMLAYHFGWKVLYLVHSKKTIKKYEEILGLKLSDAFDEFGPDADRTNAYMIIQKVSNFWKLVSGDEKSPLDLDKRGLADKGT
jgi:hypothetical protein